MICIISLVAFAYSKQLTAAVTLYFTLFAFWCVLKHLYTDLREKTSCVVHLQHATGSGRVFSGFGVSLKTCGVGDLIFLGTQDLPKLARDAG